MIKQEDMGRLRRPGDRQRQAYVARRHAIARPERLTTAVPKTAEGWPVQAPTTGQTKKHFGRRVGIALLTLGLGSGGIIAGLLITSHRAVTNPVPASLVGSVDFTVYYPASLPAGYKLDQQSFSSPQSDVIVFSLIGPKSQKIYLSEEARPSSFDLGGYYNNLSDKQLTTVSNGTIAVGRINNGSTEIGSLAINKTWVLTNTSANIPFSQLRAMLDSLRINN